MKKISILLIIMIASCSGNPSQASDGLNLRELRKDYNNVDQSLRKIESPGQGIAKSLYGPGDYEREIVFENRKRRYTLHVPPSYKSTAPTPVVLNFHGGGGRSASARLQTLMDAKADRSGFIVAYPDGTGSWGRRFLTWNAGVCCGYAQEKNVDDVGFINALLNDLAKLYNIDQKRIYATGLSNGAMMTYRLACELNNRIAAIAPVAATLGFPSCNPARPISILHFHGTADQNAPYGGGSGKYSTTGTNHRSVRDNINFWIKQNKCAEKPVKKYTEKEANIEVYRCSSGSEVVLVSINKMGHGWPGGRQMLKKDMEGQINHSVNAVNMMWEFFQKHPLD